jgi:hypothetical protein
MLLFLKRRIKMDQGIKGHRVGGNATLPSIDPSTASATAIFLRLRMAKSLEQECD